MRKENEMVQDGTENEKKKKTMRQMVIMEKKKMKVRQGARK